MHGRNIKPKVSGSCRSSKSSANFIHNSSATHETRTKRQQRYIHTKTKSHPHDRYVHTYIRPAALLHERMELLVSLFSRNLIQLSGVRSQTVACLWYANHKIFNSHRQPGIPASGRGQRPKSLTASTEPAPHHRRRLVALVCRVICWRVHTQKREIDAQRDREIEGLGGLPVY